MTARAGGCDGRMGEIVGLDRRRPSSGQRLESRPFRRFARVAPIGRSTLQSPVSVGLAPSVRDVRPKCKTKSRFQRLSGALSLNTCLYFKILNQSEANWSHCYTAQIFGDYFDNFARRSRYGDSTRTHGPSVRRGLIIAFWSTHRRANGVGHSEEIQGGPQT